MKNILLLLITVSSINIATNPPALLNQYFNFDSNKSSLEDITLEKYGEQPDVHLNEQGVYLPTEREEELKRLIKSKNYNDFAKEIFLDYQQKIKSEKEIFEKATEITSVVINEVINEENHENLLTVSSSSEDFELKPNVLYFIDFDNEVVFSKETEEYTQTEQEGLYNIYWIESMKRLIVQEPITVNSDKARSIYFDIETDSLIMDELSNLFKAVEDREKFKIERFEFDINKLSNIDI